MIPSFIKEREEQGLGFDLYFAGSQSQLTENWMLENGSCRLQSQLNDRKNISRWVEHKWHGKLFIDSGAYTAHTLGKELNVDEYIDYINGITDDLYVFAQVDHIPGTNGNIEDAAKISWDNYLYMRSKIKQVDKLMPIFHQGESFDWLRNMASYTDESGKAIDYIGFGALVGCPLPDKKRFFDKCFNVLEQCGRNNIKVHAMGMTSLPLLESYPFYSADSTSWIMCGASGTIMTPWGHVDVSEKDKYSKTNLRNLPHGKVILDWLEKNGLNVDELYENYKARMLCNLIYLTEWAKNYKYKGGGVKKKSLF